MTTTKKKTKREITMTLEEATKYLKSIGEWETVWKMDLDTILKWASFLKGKNVQK